MCRLVNLIRECYIIRMWYKPAFMLLLLVGLPAVALAAFGGKPPLGPGDALRHEFKPYDLVKLNYLGMNYCENLLDMRVNTPSYTHLGFDSNSSDAWHLHFPDDAGRLMECIAWEDEFSPVVRLELMRRMVKGMLAAHVPGTKGYSSFRHRSGGKTFLITDDEDAGKQGQFVVVNWGDSVESGVTIGFRACVQDTWFATGSLERSDEVPGLTGLGNARSPRYWNESPITIKRHYRSDACSFNAVARYWMSDEDMPLEFSFDSGTAQHTQIVVGEQGKPIPFMGDKNAPGVIHLPDGTTFSSDKAADKTFERPKFSYLILRKATAFASPGYSTAMLVMWWGNPEKIEALAANGYGEIRIQYAGAAGKVWLLPVQWVNSNDMDYLHLNAQSFLKTGKLIHNGYPSQQLVNAAAAGLAAGAYLLSKYGDPLAVTARINAENAVDEVFDAENDGMKLVRVFFPVKAAAWMVKTGKAIGDKRLVDKYTPLVDRAMRRMLSELGYDGKGWASGWDHFNAIKACRLAYDATGNQEYLDAYNRALTVYTIDSKGIYRYGVAMKAPGGFETYSGALALGAWGNAGKLDWCEALVNLDVPNGWNSPAVPLKDIWNDAGAGPWAQDDANPEYLGYSLRGANMPQKSKYVLPLGSFPTYDSSGRVEVTREPMVENPFYPKGGDKLVTLPQGKKLRTPEVKTIALKPLDKLGDSVTYKLDAKGAKGASFEAKIKGAGYRIDASPDGKRWYTRLLTWSDKPCMQSVDLSEFAGSRDELIKLVQIVPGKDAAYLAAGESSIRRENCRYVTSDKGFVYKIQLPDVVECRLEMIVGNGYKVQCSSDGRTWRDGISAGQIKTKPVADAAWIRMVDVTEYLRDGGNVYLRLTDSGSDSYGGSKAFLRRITAYGVFASGSVQVRVTNTSRFGDPASISSAAFRKW